MNHKSKSLACLVISGIASLLPKCDGDGKKKSGAEKKKSNNELNNENHVKVLDGKVTDGWDTFKKTLESKFWR